MLQLEANAPYLGGGVPNPAYQVMSGRTIPGADGLFDRPATLLGLGKTSGDRWIESSENMTAGLSILGRDQVDDFIVGTRFGDYIYGEQYAVNDTTYDTVYYCRSEVGVQVRFDVNGVGSGVGGHAEGDRLYGIEAFAGSSHHDFVRFVTSDFAEDVNNDNWLIGNDGNDTLDGGYGFDHYAGGAGADIFVIGQDLDVIHNADQFDRLYVCSHAFFPDYPFGYELSRDLFPILGGFYSYETGPDAWFASETYVLDAPNQSVWGNFVLRASFEMDGADLVISLALYSEGQTDRTDPAGDIAAGIAQGAWVRVLDYQEGDLGLSFEHMPEDIIAANNRINALTGDGHTLFF